MPKHNLNNQLEKIVVNTGIGRFSSQGEFENKILPELIKEISLITGQKPTIRAAKKSISSFKVRTGTIVGLKVTLRSKKMNDFLTKFVKIVLPRVRDFRGINITSVDKNGNLTIGIKEQLVFPEISPESSKVNFGLEITLVSKIKKQEQAVGMYKTIGIPFKK